MKIKEVARITGLSIRNLQFYDDAGLVTPGRDQNNYRDYSIQDLRRLQLVLTYKAVGLSLEEIKTVMNGSDEDQLHALGRQIEILKEKRKRIDNVIAFAEMTMGLGPEAYPFEFLNPANFDSRMKRLRSAKEYEETVEAMKSLDDKAQEKMMEEMFDIFSRFESMKGTPVGEPRVQKAVDLYIQWYTFYFKSCPPYALYGEEEVLYNNSFFAKMVDEYLSVGTAKYISEAILYRYIDLVMEGIGPILKKIKQLGTRSLEDPLLRSAGKELLKRTTELYGINVEMDEEFLDFWEDFFYNVVPIRAQDPEIIEAKEIAFEALRYQVNNEKKSISRRITSDE